MKGTAKFAKNQLPLLKESVMRYRSLCTLFLAAALLYGMPTLVLADSSSGTSWGISLGSEGNSFQFSQQNYSSSYPDVGYVGHNYPSPHRPGYHRGPGRPLHPGFHVGPRPHHRGPIYHRGPGRPFHPGFHAGPGPHHRGPGYHRGPGPHHGPAGHRPHHN